MQHNNHRPVRWPGINDVEHELTATELFHRLSVSRGYAPAGELARARATANSIGTPGALLDDP
jgi:hypothetical protein